MQVALIAMASSLSIHLLVDPFLCSLINLLTYRQIDKH